MSFEDESPKPIQNAGPKKSTRHDEVEELRAKRVPFGQRKRKTAGIVERPGWHQRLVNSTRQGRVQQMEESGYQMSKHMKAPTGEAFTVQSGSDRLVLMEIPDEFYNEDQTSKSEDMDEIDEMLNTNGSLRPLKGNQMILDGHKITHSG